MKLAAGTGTYTAYPVRISWWAEDRSPAERFVVSLINNGDGKDMVLVDPYGRVVAQPSLESPHTRSADLGLNLRSGPFRGACGGQVVDAGRAVDDRRLGRQPLVAVGGVRVASGAGAPCAGTAGAGGVRRAARSTPMTAPMSHSAKATDPMPPLQKPDRHSTATA